MGWSNHLKPDTQFHSNAFLGAEALHWKVKVELSNKHVVCIWALRKEISLKYEQCLLKITPPPKRLRSQETVKSWQNVLWDVDNSHGLLRRILYWCESASSQHYEPESFRRLKSIVRMGADPRRRSDSNHSAEPPPPSLPPTPALLFLIWTSNNIMLD